MKRSGAAILKERYRLLSEVIRVTGKGQQETRSSLSRLKRVIRFDG
jgi:hypothetical protein